MEGIFELVVIIYDHILFKSFQHMLQDFTMSLHFPICQWANAATTRKWMSKPWARLENCSAQKADPLSTTNWRHGPAQANQWSYRTSNKLKASVWNTGCATWKHVATSIQCKNWCFLPVLAVQVTRSHRSLRSHWILEARTNGLVWLYARLLQFMTCATAVIWQALDEWIIITLVFQNFLQFVHAGMA